MCAQHRMRERARHINAACKGMLRAITSSLVLLLSGLIALLRGRVNGENNVRRLAATTRTAGCTIKPSAFIV